MTNTFTNFNRDEQATTTVEYSVMLALIALVCIAAINLVGFESLAFWNRSADAISEVIR